MPLYPLHWYAAVYHSTTRVYGGWVMLILQFSLSVSDSALMDWHTRPSSITNLSIWFKFAYEPSDANKTSHLYHLFLPPNLSHQQSFTMVSFFVIRWLKYWSSASASVPPQTGLIFRIDWLISASRTSLSSTLQFKSTPRLHFSL